MLKRTSGVICARTSESLSRGVNATVRGHLGFGGHEHAFIDLEVGVGVKDIERLKTRDGLLEPRSNGLVRASGGELSEPDGLAAADLAGLLDVLEEGLTILNFGVPVDVTEVVVALLTTELVTLVDEAAEPLPALAGKTTVADGRSTDEGLASVRVEKLDVSLSSVSRRHVSLASVVGLVEGEDSLGTVGEGLGAVAGEAVDVDRVSGPEGRNEVHTFETTRFRVPVVTPATVLAVGGESVGHFDVIVADTSLVGEASRATGRAGAGGGLLGGASSLDLLDLLGGSLLLSLGSLIGSGGRLGGGLSSLGRLGDLDDSSRLGGSGGGSSRNLGPGSGLGSSRSAAGAEVVVLPRDDLAVNGGSDPVTLLGVLVMSVAVAEGKSRLKESGGGSKDGELVGDHLD